MVKDILLEDNEKDEDIKRIVVNSNETGDKTKLKFVKHYLGINFCPVPFLWHYDDFAQPYPVYGLNKIKLQKLFNKVKDKNNNLKLALNGLNDRNTDIFTIAQYKNDSFLYNESSNSDEIYLSYHTWLYMNLTKNYEINNKIKENYKFRFLTGIYPIEGKINHSDTYPHIVFEKNGVEKKIPAGIAINTKPELRQANLHKYKDIIRFSSKGVCNFYTNEENLVFVSIMRFPFLVHKNNKIKVNTSNNKQNIVVLHILRNKADNNPKDPKFRELVDEYL